MDNINNVLDPQDMMSIRSLCVDKGEEFILIIPTEDHLRAILEFLHHLGLRMPSWNIKVVIKYLDKPKGLGLVVRPMHDIGFSYAAYFTQEDKEYSKLKHLYLQVKD